MKGDRHGASIGFFVLTVFPILRKCFEKKKKVSGQGKGGKFMGTKKGLLSEEGREGTQDLGT